MLRNSHAKKSPANFGTVQHGQKQEVFALGSHGFGQKNWLFFFAFFFFFFFKDKQTLKQIHTLP